MSTLYYLLSTMAGSNSGSDPGNIISSSENDNNNDVFGDRVEVSSSENDNDNDVFGDRVKQAIATSTFYGSRIGHLRPRKPLPTSQSSSSSSESDKEALCVSDDSDLDPTHEPPAGNRSSSDMFASEDDTPKVVSKRGRPRGSKNRVVRTPVRRGTGTRGRPRGSTRGRRSARGLGSALGRGRGRQPHTMSDTDTEAVSPTIAPATPPPVVIPVPQPGTSAQEDPVTPSTGSGQSSRKRPRNAGTPREKGPGRKQVRSPSTWLKNVAKKARAHGEAYTSVKTGIQRPAAKVGAPCKCKNKCFELLGEDKIAAVFKSYFAIGDNYVAKQVYLCGLVRNRDVKRCRQRDPTKPTKDQYYYMIRDSNNVEVAVCRKAFA